MLKILVKRLYRRCCNVGIDAFLHAITTRFCVLSYYFFHVLCYYYPPRLLSVFAVDLFWDSAKLKVGFIAVGKIKATVTSFWHGELVKLSDVFLHIEPMPTE